MISFAKIRERAAQRKGSDEILMSLMPQIRSADDIAKIPDDRFLAEMTKCIFQAGFAWSVINKKWDGFEAAFQAFDIGPLLFMPDEDWEALGRDTRIVRNMQKIMSVRGNAQFLADIASEHDSYANFVAYWPEDNIIGLLEVMKKRGSRLGGMTGQRALRQMGKDCIMLTGDVVTCLQDAGLDIKDHPTSKSDMQKIQNAFNQYRDESGLPLAYINRIIAYSVGENMAAESLRDRGVTGDHLQT